ncbi:NUDIX hydrolase [Cytobacillus purgationiresistens]|uniref:ADP-ribose pyrophosphatase YjhB (NUDIX family) n=1 Tax=Cytobacillus purgationiresistens TaxID=863449 RepID=A0ABU0AJS3_9BACI|nr:NUDIX domain-containing protein [Cytobacillus purgationiresistens]MDQ0271516.1 ADP-ribose pyrophosphatase YjhB (NUDIX family) [Cytobacillus purgationiresistens]
MFIVNVEGAVHFGGKWLVIERSLLEDHAAGTLSLVGGKVDREGFAKHILETSVQREIFEEVGVKVKQQMDYVRSTSFVADDGAHVIDVVFLCQYEGGEAYQKSSDEVGAVHWLTTKEIIHHPLAPVWLKESILAAEKLRKK